MHYFLHNVEKNICHLSLCPTCMMRLHGVEAEVPGGEDAEARVEARVDEAPVVQPVV